MYCGRRRGSNWRLCGRRDGRPSCGTSIAGAPAYQPSPRVASRGKIVQAERRQWGKSTSFPEIVLELVLDGWKVNENAFLKSNGMERYWGGVFFEEICSFGGGYAEVI